MFGRVLAVALCVALVLTHAALAAPQQPQNPIMGIITDPAVECATPALGTDCVESFYVRWLATAGIRSIPIPWNYTKPKRDALLRKVNGVLFPGGDLDGALLSQYQAVVQDVVDTALMWNRQGDPFLVWGTCMGFQVVAAALARDPTIIQCDLHGTDPSMLPLQFTNWQPSSRMFGTQTTPAKVLHTLTAENSTLNWHSCRIPPQAVMQHSSFSSTTRILSTNVDINGIPFVSSLEGIDAEVYAVQFHPERIQFEFTSDVIGHTPSDIEAMEYLALFILSRLQRNNHTFATPAEAEAHSIFNYPIHNYGLGFELYWMNPDYSL